MKALILLLVIALAIGYLFAIGFPTGGSASFSVLVPGASSNPALSNQVVAFASSHDWTAECAKAGINLRAKDLAALTDDLAKENIEIGSGRLSFHFTYEVQQTIGARRHPIHAALELIRIRLGVEANAIGYASVGSAERQRLVWKMYGSGFDDRLRNFLDSAIPNETNAEVRRYLEKMRSRI